MRVFTKRNLKLYFRDKTSVMFSLLAVVIVILLYALFLGDVWMENLEGMDGAQALMNSWIAAGLMTVASVTTTLGAFGAMVDDRFKKIEKDFRVSPLKRSGITGGYLMSAFFIGVLMSLLMLLLAEGYIFINGGEFISAETLLKVLGVILLGSMANTAMMCFIVSFFKSANAFTTASVIIGTLIGFVTGIYMPIGLLPQAVQTGIKLFPASHAAALFRQLMTEKPLEITFAGVPEAIVEQFKEKMGIEYFFGDFRVTPQISILVLLGTVVLFYLLAVLNMSRKRQ